MDEKRKKKYVKYLSGKYCGMKSIFNDNNNKNQ
jgi:hypothetical protein